MLAHVQEELDDKNSGMNIMHISRTIVGVHTRKNGVRISRIRI